MKKKIDIEIIDKKQIPQSEPERQYYFMDIAKNYVEQLAAKKGSPLTFHAAGRTALPGMRVSGATVLSVAIAIAATLLTWHTAGGGRHGVCFAFAVLLDWALLGALMVRIRQQESAA